MANTLLGPAYRYAATITDVHDGDTVRADVSLGFDTWRHEQAFRLLSVNAIELRDPGGQEARANLLALLTATPGVILSSVKPDKYGGRYDAHITLPDGVDVSELLIRSGWAAPWTGRGARPLPPWPRPGT